MNEITGIVDLGFYWTYLAAWRTVPVFLVVLLLTSLFRNRIPARVHCLLWLVVIARLILPISMPSPVAMETGVNSLVGKFLVMEEPVNDSSTPPHRNPYTLRDEKGKTATVLAPIVPIVATADEVEQAESEIVELEASSIEVADVPKSKKAADFVEYCIYAIDRVLKAIGYLIVWGWVIGFTIITFRGTLAYTRFSFQLQVFPTIENQAIVDRVLRACDRIGVGRRPRIKEVTSLDAPAVFGLLRPVICLPANWRDGLSGEKLDWVLRHELAHIKRRDALVLCVAGFVRALHWFNPVSWIAIAKLRHSMERAADAVATRDMSETNVRDYGILLLEYAAGQTCSRQSATVGLLAMAMPRGLQRRIESLANSRPGQSWLTWIMMFSMVAIIAATGLTDTKTFETTAGTPRSIPNFEVAIAGSDWKRSVNNQVETLEPQAVSINVEKAMRKAKELQPRVNAEKFVLNYFAASTAVSWSKTHRIVNGVFCLNATPQEVATIKQRLAAFEASGPWKIATDLRFIETNVRLLNWIDWSVADPTTSYRRVDDKALFENSQDWNGLSFESWPMPFVDTTPLELERTSIIPLRAVKITRMQSERLIDQMQSDYHSNFMQAPKMTMFNGQCGMLRDVVLSPFVTDVTIIRGELANAYQPKISVFEEGCKFLVKPTVNEEQKVNLKIVLNQSSVVDVRQANLPNVAGGDGKEDVIIQVPSVQSDSIVVESVLGEDEVLLVLSPTPYSSDEAKNARSRDHGMAQVFMIRTELISDIDILKEFVVDQSDHNAGS